MKKLDPQVLRRIRKDINQLRTVEEPWKACKALSGPLAGYWRRRVGDYRLIMYFERNQLVIVLTDVGHRFSIYS